MRQNRLIRIIIIVVGIGLIISLSRNIYRLLKAGDQVKLAQERLEELEIEHQELLELRDYYQSEEFIEKEARDKLNLSRPEETVVILPPNVGEIVGKITPSPAPELPNWRRWLKLFF